MSNKTNDIVNESVYDFLADQCEAGIITLEQYNLMKKNLNEMPSAEEVYEPTSEDCKDDHIQIEVEEHKDELIKDLEDNDN